GQLAGTHYGVEGIPEEWRGKLALRATIEGFADGLLAAAQKSTRSTSQSIQEWIEPGSGLDSPQVSEGHTGASLGGFDKSPKRRKRDAARRRREEKRWAAKSGPVTSYIDPSRTRPKPDTDAD